WTWRCTKSSDMPTSLVRGTDGWALRRPSTRSRERSRACRAHRARAARRPGPHRRAVRSFTGPSEELPLVLDGLVLEVEEVELEVPWGAEALPDPAEPVVSVEAEAFHAGKPVKAQLVGMRALQLAAPQPMLGSAVLVPGESRPVRPRPGLFPFPGV